MAKTYRATQHWNHWLSQNPGRDVLGYEQYHLDKLLKNYFGKHSLLIGVPQQSSLTKATVTTDQILLSTLYSRKLSIKLIESSFYELPVLSGSVDLVLLPHTLEYTENPRQLLSESCRIVKPEGHIVILGFNPVSLWGLRKLFGKTKEVPWSMNFHQAATIKKWLGFADFELIKQESFLFMPPLRENAPLDYSRSLEWLGRKIFKPFGGIYVLIAKAKVIPLTPIRLRWEQQLTGLQVTTPGPPMRDF